jgi:3D (Asp-Asp-Asp) domain-containing protein
MNIVIISTILGSLLGTFGLTAAIPASAPAPAGELAQEIVSPEPYEVVKSFKGEVTGYSSREEETDETPFIAASGDTVYWGMVATNAYPFGTRIRFPELYGDKVFVVGDRMNARYQNRIDIWFPEYERALAFGLQNTKVEIVRDTALAEATVRK